MNIAIDARWIFPRLSGIGSYTRELIRHLVPIESRHRFLILVNDEEVERHLIQYADLEGLPRVRTCFFPYGLFSFQSQLRLPALLREREIHVYHAPNYMIPYAAFAAAKGRRKTACVVTMHDLIPLRFPQFTPHAMKTRLYPVFKQIMKMTTASADMIIVPSEATRRDVEAVLQPERCRRAPQMAVIHEGVQERYKPCREDEKRPCTLLYVGRFDPYKNVPGLIRAFHGLKAHCPECELFLVGGEDPRYPEGRRLAAELGIEDRIRWMGYVDDLKLARLYAEASLFVIPSRYEGFGLPILEAMAGGTPVICGDNSAQIEVAGDAALRVNVADESALTRAMWRVLSDPELARDLRERGLNRAAAFSWRQTAAQTLAAYEQAYDHMRRPR